MEKMMDKYESAKAWGVTPDYARMLMRMMPEARKVITEAGVLTWMVPEGTTKPEKSKKGKGN